MNYCLITFVNYKSKFSMINYLCRIEYICSGDCSILNIPIRVNRHLKQCSKPNKNGVWKYLTSHNGIVKIIFNYLIKSIP